RQETAGVGALAAGWGDPLSAARKPLGTDCLGPQDLQDGGYGQGQLSRHSRLPASAGEDSREGARGTDRQDFVCHFHGRVAVYTEWRIAALEAGDAVDGRYRWAPVGGGRNRP